MCLSGKKYCFSIDSKSQNDLWASLETLQSAEVHGKGNLVHIRVARFPWLGERTAVSAAEPRSHGLADPTEPCDEGK